MSIFVAIGIPRVARDNRFIPLGRKLSPGKVEQSKDRQP